MTRLAQLPLTGLADETAGRVDASPRHEIPMPAALVEAPMGVERELTPIAANAGVPRHARPPAAAAEAGCERLLTFGEAARVLGISLRHFRRLVDRGMVGYVRVSERSPRVRPSELRRFVGAAAIKHSEGSP
jgi:excisionase family DNA binding protein